MSWIALLPDKTRKLTSDKPNRISKIRGFTLIELTLALGIGTVILSGAVLGIYQIMVTTGRGNDQSIALSDVNTAALAIKKDLMMAQTTDLSSTPKNSAGIGWIDYSSFGSSNQTTHSANYTLSGRQLRRTYDGNMSIVGRNIVSVSFSQTGNYVTVTLSSSNTKPSSQIESITFSAHLRAEEVE